ncbi:hypothetical protein N2152v2_008411 [Parachlorella kessleri]
MLHRAAASLIGRRGLVAVENSGLAGRPFSGVVAGQDTPLKADQVPKQVSEDYGGQVSQAPEDAQAGPKAGGAEKEEPVEMSKEQQEKEAEEDAAKERAMDPDSGYIGYGSEQAHPVPPQADMYSGGDPTAGSDASTSKEEEGAKGGKGA